MFSLFIELVLVVGASVLAHAFVAYVLAPSRAKKAILSALISDPEFQSQLMVSLVTNASKPMKFKDEQGQEFMEAPIKLLARIISVRFQADFKSYVGGKQSEMIRDMENNAQTSMATMPNNPLMALALAQIPKKYLPYLQILMNLSQQQQ